MKERIDKIIASQGKYSRTEVKKLIKNGSVKLNGAVVHSPEEKADAENDVISLNGEAICFRRFLYIMMNKPQGVISATSDRTQRTVLDLLPDEMRRDGLFPAGRLDGDTTGFVLITDDGETAHKMLSPKSHVSKVYLARLAYPLSSETADIFKTGVILSDGSVCMSAVLTLLEDGETPLVKVILKQGMYHQIKRMFASCGNRVIALKRIQIGGVTLDSKLKEGECRLLTADEIKKLTQMEEQK
ncbi:MAG: rRNA pseudouridine synthase [Clostridia bacterium]|nr:rRNA pseudouridine synthase [Clostridia bacterium]